ncbi:macro domain-containing protein, partial [Enterobacter hormaechei]|uniref:macro domain-containing protein n=1 Tax=Enterobacter hormaechei TaxID=158836 RepID=UPI003CC5FDC5
MYRRKKKSFYSLFFRRVFFYFYAKNGCTLKTFKRIAFNEYFDTKVDEKIISSTSLNGQYINKFFPNSVNELDKIITEYEFEEEEKIGINNERRVGKKVKYSLGTTCVIDDYLLTAF